MNYRLKHAHERRKQRLITVAILVIAFAATLAYLQSRLWIVDLSYEYMALQTQVEELRNEQAQLRFDVGELRAPKRIETIARNRLGLKVDAERSSAMTVIYRSTDTP